MAVTKRTARRQELEKVERTVRSAIAAVRQVNREHLVIDYSWSGEDDPNGGSMKSRALSFPGHLAAVIIYGDTEELVEARVQRLLRGWELAGKDGDE